ncbi:peptidase C14, caspase catalytic subunit P20 [Lentzea aerocolonigenes]|uniref:Peptidase C14, caspase catalytic subunit P20 n=1 Tax=Lentzea aerocolonigenes TaxID=68170 RepID=A0A0F0H3Y9_LENAE|nr:DUF4232 domain-containing protein [Lentzea aerocolonigenes]KJK49581.1 peptidase C14, caspase catalytic subunit P20 [Lentzea aerocolonigenes]
MTRRLIVCGLLVLAGVTACGDRTSDNGTQTMPTSTPSSPPSTTAAPANSGAAAPAMKRCDSTVLKGQVDPTDAGAGNRYGKFVVQNSSTAPCTLNGYSGFQLENGSGAVPTKLERKADPGPKALTLAPGAKASANLHWGVVPSGNEPVEGPCQPEPSKAAAIPPDETAPLTVPWTLGPVCSGGRIEISAFYAS